MSLVTCQQEGLNRSEYSKERIVGRKRTKDNHTTKREETSGSRRDGRRLIPKLLDKSARPPLAMSASRRNATGVADLPIRDGDTARRP